MPQQHGGDYCGQHFRDGERQPHAGRQQAREQPCRRQYEDKLTQQRHEQHQAPPLGATWIESVTDAIGGMMTPTGSDYDPTLAEWYEMLKRKKKKKKAHGISR